jgi:hypothetical protein
MSLFRVGHMLSAGDDSFAIPLAHLCVSFAFFTLVQKRELTRTCEPSPLSRAPLTARVASIVFSAIGGACGWDVLEWQALSGCLQRSTRSRSRS